ncbi:MAG TPA: phosphatase PAP2 family protein, partial [Candidatus Goldiibacteriota bacterium]|nr:phosphatase PAP2 family protein [Candidatus Goldiibacteriota bacterium]
VKKTLTHLLILLILTIPFWFSNLDIAFSRLFFRVNSGWYLSNNGIVNFLYKYGTYPAIIFSVCFILVLTFQKFFRNKENLKKTAIVFLITLIFAPGIIINVLLKNYTGRPRPREITEFNGKWEYRRVLQLGQPGRGHSFPCGHCSMGFIFCSIYFVLKNKRKISANIALWSGLIYGTMIGMARIAQGAHFLSDVIWAGGITILISEIAFYLLFAKEKNENFQFLTNGKIPVAMSIFLSAILILGLFVFFLMSVPLYKENKTDLDLKGSNLKFVFNGFGDLKINAVDEKPYISILASGFGFPRSNYLWNVERKEKQEVTEISFNTYKTGFFQELSADVCINFLKGKNGDIIINNVKGDIDCDLTGMTAKCILFTREGDVSITVDGIIKELFLKSLKGNIRLNLNKNAVFEPYSFIAINAAAGDVEIKNHSNFMKELNENAVDINGAKELYLQSKKNGHLYLDVNAVKIIVDDKIQQIR